ncbi:hypothetical protein COCNU_06G005360 [Cocos nucifera]|uniref:Uncharacterized protein n=1 Tax=Cocos nucifera TaxID=13894 RepID=A0A8K0IB97_COCNU|nr:hypothetical protein COCNU_06G005360 [Cocos nucifera]
MMTKKQTNANILPFGLQIPKGGPGITEEIQNQSSKPPIFAAEPTVAAKEYDMPLGVDIYIPKADAVAAISACMSDHGSMRLNKRPTEASDNSMGRPNDINENQDHSGQLGNSFGRFHHKKSRKVGLLEDIIRSEESCMHKKVHISGGDTNASQIKNDGDTRLDASNWKLKHPANKSHLATQNIQETPTMEASQNEDKENSLMDWLKRVSRKGTGHKGHSENKHIDAAVGISSGSSSGQGPSRYDLQSALKNENKMPPLKPGCPCLVPQQDIFIAQDVPTKLLLAKIDNNKSTGCIGSEKSQHHGPEIQEGTNTKAILTNKKKNKAPSVEDRLKDSFDTFEHSGFQVKKKPIKKQKTANICEQEGLDDIPMDIVELLAKHQHERRLMSAGVAAENMYNLSEMTGNMRDGKDSERRCDESKVSDAAPKNLSQQRSHFNQAIDAIHKTMSNKRDDSRLKACDSLIFCKKNLHIDLNQQPTDFLELPQCSGDPLGRLEHPVTASNRTNFSLDKMKMQNSGSRHRDHATATKISSRNDHDGTSAPLNGTAFGSVTRKHHADFNYVNVDSHDSCLDQSLKTVDKKISCHDSHDPKFTGVQLLLGKEKVNSSINICPAFAEAGNGCHSRTIKPLDLYADETISALYLLRLMDQTAGLGASDTNQSRSILESDLNCTDQFEELQGLEFGFGTKEMPNHPKGARYSDQDQQQGNSSKPCHPVPTISVLGSLLHKEIVTQSNNCQILQGFQARHPNELPLHNNIEKVKTDASRSAIHPEAGKTMTSTYVGVNSKEIFSDLDSVAHSSFSQKTVDKKISCHDSHDPKFTGVQLLLGKEKVNSSINICPAFAEAGNGCHSRTIKPLDLYADETISALYLLRLMDQTAGLGASDTNQSRSILESDLNCTDQFRELQGLEFGFGTKEMPNHPKGARYSDQDQHQGNSSKPCHPVPTISVLGSLLHKEIVTQSNNCQILQGFQARHPNELPLHNNIEKDSFDTFEHSGFQVKKKPIKKQKTANICEQEGLDDIPMDIVELLAKHQHERRLMSAGVAAENMYNLSEMTGNMRDGKDSERRCDESKVSDAAPKNLSQQRSHFNQAIDAIHKTMSNKRDDSRLKACDSLIFCKKNLHIDLNQQPTDFLELPQCSGDPLGRLEHPVTASNRTNFSLDKMKMQNSGSRHRDHATATKISSRNDHDGTSAPLNGTAFGSVTRKHHADFNYVNVDSHDSCLDQSLKTVDKKISCHDSHDPKFTGVQLLLGKEKVNSSINICPAFAEAGNGCHSRTIKPLDLYADETISALYLLRLMDQTAGLGASDTNQFNSSINICPAFAEAGNGCHSRTIKPLDLYADETISALYLLRLMDQTAGLGASDTNQSRSILESDLNCTDQFEELQGLEFGFGTKEMPNHPKGARYSDQDQQQGNSSKPCHPVPTISVLGSLLHKEIVTQSNNCQILQGFQARHPNELPLHNNIEKVKTDASRSAIHPEAGKTMTSTYVGVNSKEIFSDLDSVAHSSFSQARYEIDRAGTSNKDKVVQTLTSHCEFGNCVVNRNPADFATPDEDVHTIGSNDTRTRYISFSKMPAVSNSSRWTQAAASDEAHCSKGLMRS